MPDSVTIELPGLRAARGTLSGAKPGLNQDAAAMAPGHQGLVCAVADGVSSTPEGGTAAQAAVDALLGTYLGNDDSGVDAVEALRAAVESAHKAVCAAISDAQAGATTIVGAAIRGNRVYIVNVGDSRAYAFDAAGDLEQITADHSWVAEQIQAGALDRSAAAAHPWRSVITRYLGGDAAPEVDTFARALAPGAGVLLCSDGLMGALTEAEVAKIVALADPEAAVAALLQIAEERGAHDDVTICIAQLDASEDAR